MQHEPYHGWTGYYFFQSQKQVEKQLDFEGTFNGLDKDVFTTVRI
jgi:hypothetical protein